MARGIPARHREFGGNEIKLIGQILGRWGNFMNREAFGAETDIFCRMGLISPDGSAIYVHPTFLYESIWCLLLFILIMIFRNYQRYHGEVLLWYLGGYGLERMIVEGLRTDSLMIGQTGIAVSQLLSAVLFLGSLVVLIVMRVKKKKNII